MLFYNGKLTVFVLLIKFKRFVKHHNFQRTDMQIDFKILKEKNGRDVDVVRSITLDSFSQKAYKLLLKKGYPLPSFRTLQRWFMKVDIAKGILKIWSETLKMGMKQKNCVLSFDEMKIKRKYCYDKNLRVILSCLQTMYK